MLRKIKNFIKSYYLKRGRKLKNQYVIIESDDWGAVRSTPKSIQFLKSIDKYNELDSYQRYDCLETHDDLQKLYEVLIKFKDKKGRHPLFQLNYIMQNLKTINFNNGSFELVNTFDYYGKDGLRIKNIISNGIKNNVFLPQLHGLWHLNIEQLIEDCKKNNIIKECFTNYGAVGYGEGIMKGMDTFADHNNFSGSIVKAANIFNEEFGFMPKSVIFPCYTWAKDQEDELLELDIKTIQGSLFQYDPRNKKRKMHFNGQKNRKGQFYFVRNVFFEPNKDRIKGTLNKCVENSMSEIKTAFKNSKPAIICTHRCNFVGSIDRSVRDQNLELLKKLLERILEEFPDCEFISTCELKSIIGD